MNDNRQIHLHTHHHVPEQPQQQRQSLGFSGVLGVIVITLVVAWFFK